MARDERLKKVQGAGADFLETARARAEEFLRELSRAGGDTQERAQGALDDLMEGGRKGTEQLVSLIRKEITNQLGLLGLATKDDLAALEQRLSRRPTAAKSAAPAAKTAARRTAATKSAAATRSTAASKSAASKSAATTTRGASKTAARKAPAKKSAAKKTAG